MAGRRTEDDVMARGAAEQMVADFFDVNPDEAVRDGVTPVDLVKHFKAVQFETHTTRVGGEEIPLRRVVMTSEWEVNPNAVR